MRVFDGNRLPASEKRLAPLRGFRGAALPGHTLVVYDPDSALVCDILACEDAHESERIRARRCWVLPWTFCGQIAQPGKAMPKSGQSPC